MKSTCGHSRSALLLACCFAGLAHADPTPVDVTFHVNSMLDQIDDNVLDGLCHTAGNTCTLRAAIMQANHKSGPGIAHILLQAGIYILTQPPTGTAREDNGDLNLTPPLSADQVISIEGVSAASSVIDANGIDRVMTIEQDRVVNISNVTIRGGSTNFNGAGIELRGTLMMQDSIVADNRGNYGGGMMVWTSGRLDVLRSTFRSNEAGNGGAVFAQGQTTFRKTSLTGNLAFVGGAIFVFEGSARMNLLDSTISSNAANRDGGGIYVYSGQSFIINSTISGNTANENGGGIYNYGTTWIYNTSIIANDSSHDRNPPGGIGGGVYNRSGYRLVAINSLIADNTTLSAPFPDDCNGVLELYGWNLLTDYGGCTFSGNGLAARGLVSTNTIGPLADNGGPTLTHALLAGSEAIDTTTAQGCIDTTGTALATDQRGAPRIAGAACDVGAFEYNSIVLSDDVIFTNGFDLNVPAID